MREHPVVSSCHGKRTLRNYSPRPSTPLLGVSQRLRARGRPPWASSHTLYVCLDCTRLGPEPSSLCCCARNRSQISAGSGSLLHRTLWLSRRSVSSSALLLLLLTGVVSSSSAWTTARRRLHTPSVTSHHSLGGWRSTSHQRAYLALISASSAGIHALVSSSASLLSRAFAHCHIRSACACASADVILS